MTSQSRWFLACSSPCCWLYSYVNLILGGYLILFTYICKPVGTLWDLPSQFRTHSQDFSRVHITRWGWSLEETGGNGAFTSPGVPSGICSSWWHRSICQRYGFHHPLQHLPEGPANISHAGTSAIQHCGILRTQVGSISLSATSSGTRTDSAAAAMNRDLLQQPFSTYAPNEFLRACTTLLDNPCWQ